MSSTAWMVPAATRWRSSWLSPHRRVLIVGAHLAGFDPGWGPRILRGCWVRSEAAPCFGSVARLAGAKPYVRSAKRRSCRSTRTTWFATPPKSGETRLAAWPTDCAAARGARAERSAGAAGAVSLATTWSRSGSRGCCPVAGVDAALKQLEEAGLVGLDPGPCRLRTRSCESWCCRAFRRPRVESSMPGRSALWRNGVHRWRCAPCTPTMRTIHFAPWCCSSKWGPRGCARGHAGRNTGLQRGLELARLEISRGELDDPLGAMLIFGRKLGVALIRAGDFADARGFSEKPWTLRDRAARIGPESSARSRKWRKVASARPKRSDTSTRRSRRRERQCSRPGATLAETRASWVH